MSEQLILFVIGGGLAVAASMFRRHRASRFGQNRTQ